MGYTDKRRIALGRQAPGPFCCGSLMKRIHIYDTTLRDGSQGEGVNFSHQDKLNITQRLHDPRIDSIGGGYPLANPKGFEYFRAVRDLPLRHGKAAAFV